MIKQEDAISIPGTNLQISACTFTDKNDKFRDKLTRKGLYKENYARRHILISGQFKIDVYENKKIINSFITHSQVEGTNNPGEVFVWPPESMPEVESWKLTALHDNSSYYCIMSTRAEGYIVTDETIDLKPYNAFHLQRGKIYIPSVDVLVNGMPRKAYQAIACVYNEAEIYSEVEGKIVVFTEQQAKDPNVSYQALVGERK